MGWYFRTHQVGIMTDAPDYDLDPHFAVKPRRSADENAQAAWHQVLSVLAMLDDMAHAGARIRITRSPIFPAADHKALLKEGIVSRLDRILQGAEVIEC